MAYIKTYKTRANESRILFALGDVTVDAHFTNGNIRDNVYATLTTRDPLIQKVIESSPLYKRQVFLEKSVEIKEAVAAPSVNMELDKISTMQEMRQYLSKNFGIDIKAITSPNAIKARMKELGVVAPNLVW